MVEMLTTWTQAIQAVPAKWVVTLGCVLGWRVTQRIWYTPPSEHADALATGREIDLFTQVSLDGFKNAAFFGALTFNVVMWDWSWLTGPYAVLQGVVELLDLGHVALLVPASVAVVFQKSPGEAFFVVAGVIARVVFLAIGLLYVALAATAFMT